MKKDAEEQLTEKIVDSMADEIEQEMGVQRNSPKRRTKRKVSA